MASEGRLLEAEEVKSRKTGDEKRGQGRDSGVFSHPSAGVAATVDLPRRADAPPRHR